MNFKIAIALLVCSASASSPSRINNSKQSTTVSPVFIFKDNTYNAWKNETFHFEGGRAGKGLQDAFTACERDKPFGFHFRLPAASSVAEAWRECDSRQARSGFSCWLPLLVKHRRLCKCSFPLESLKEEMGQLKWEQAVNYDKIPILCFKPKNFTQPAVLQ